MRLKPTTIWPALAALVIVFVVAVALIRSRLETGPVFAGRPLSHWINVLEAGRASDKAEHQLASKAVQEAKTADPAALQSAILDRIEAAYSTSAKYWYRTYFSIPPKLRSHLPKPRFGRIEFQTVVSLDGIMPEPSARQWAAIQKILNFPYLSDAEGAAQLVALSTATQTVPESIAFLRERLPMNEDLRHHNLFEAIRSKYNYAGWHNHHEAVSGLLADLKKISASDPNPDCRVAARQAWDKLTFELGATASADATRPEPKSGSTLTQASLYADPVPPADRPLSTDASRLASDLSLQLAPPPPPPATGLFKP